MSKNFFQNIVRDLKDEDLSIAGDGTSAGEFTGFIDTGSYALNAVMSADIYGGLADNKITGFAGETTTGKTFFALGVCKNFLDANPDAGVLYYDTEAAVNKKMMSERGLDVDRVIIGEPLTVQQFKTKADNFLTKYIETPLKERPKLLMVLDSLGQLSTTKEMEDTAEGKEVRDMTRSQIIKAAFRVLTLKCARAKVPMIVTNHVYASMGSMYPTNEIAGGCLVAGTRIYMADGSLKCIEDVEVGDEVLTLNGTSDVAETFTFDDKDLYEIELEDGRIVTCSSDHRFLVNGEWVEAKNLSTFDEVEVVSDINTVVENLRTTREISLRLQDNSSSNTKTLLR